MLHQALRRLHGLIFCQNMQEPAQQLPFFAPAGVSPGQLLA